MRRAGFTLIELLAAILILSMMTIVAGITFTAVVNGWHRATKLADRMQTADYALNQVVAGLRSAYYPADGNQKDEWGFMMGDGGDGEDPSSSDWIEWTKLGTSMIGSKSAFSETTHRVRMWVEEARGKDEPGGLKIRVWNPDLFVEDDKVYYGGMYKEKIRVGCIYRRVSDEYMDPVTFEPSSLLGVPNIMQAYRAGNVALINAIGNGVADDKGIYYFVPKMVKYYLGEDSVLQNAPTYLPYFKEDCDYVMEHLDSLVIKDVSEAGGYGVVFGSELAPEKLEELRQLIVKFPRRWIAQEVVDFKDLEILEGDQLVWRKADLRAFVVTGKETKVWKSGLTRFSRNPDSFVVNSSQGGGFKDTWVMTEEG